MAFMMYYGPCLIHDHIKHCHSIRVKKKKKKERKWRRTKEPLDESEKGEWKNWLKAQHSENEDHGIKKKKEVKVRYLKTFKNA